MADFVQNSNKKGSRRNWNAYIQAMRGSLSSLPTDRQKMEAIIARQHAAARFFQGSNQHSVNRSAFHLSKLLKRQAG